MADPKDKRITTTKGPPGPSVQAGPAPEAIGPDTGQHGSYWVLTEWERAKGFVAPVRRSYIHKTCGVVTTMSQAIAETYARNPKFYSSTFCTSCRTHFPVVEFMWDGTSEEVGSTGDGQADQS